LEEEAGREVERKVEEGEGVRRGRQGVAQGSVAGGGEVGASVVAGQAGGRQRVAGRERV